MASTIVEGFSISHAQMLDGATSFLTAAALATAPVAEDIYGVQESSLDPDTDEFDNEGDDVTLSTWAWLNFADVKVKAGYLSFPLIANLTGQTISSTGAGANIIYGLDLWCETGFNVSPKPMLLKVPSKDHLGVSRTLLLGLYRVQPKPMTFDGPSYKEGLKVNYDGKALYSTVDELGVAFPDGKKRVGRLLSIA